jgi:hypothetical protein
MLSSQNTKFKMHGRCLTCRDFSSPPENWLLQHLVTTSKAQLSIANLSMSTNSSTLQQISYYCSWISVVTYFFKYCFLCQALFNQRIHNLLLFGDEWFLCFALEVAFIFIAIVNHRTRGTTRVSFKIIFASSRNGFNTKLRQSGGSGRCPLPQQRHLQALATHFWKRNRAFAPRYRRIISDTRL